MDKAGRGRATLPNAAAKKAVHWCVLVLDDDGNWMFVVGRTPTVESYKRQKTIRSVYTFKLFDL